jgi:1,4-dihydroxy-2-naphthoate octaprenyltransferase
MGKIFKLARLQFLVAGLALFLFGALVAVLLGSPFSFVRLLLGCLIVLPAQLSVNLGNDYFDADFDQPEGTTFISGGSGILLRYPELRQPVKWIITGLILFSLGMGLIFQHVYSYPFRFLGFVVLGNLLGWMYSAPPLRLSQRGLGELCFTFVAGFLVPAMGYATLRGSLDASGSIFLIPVIFYVLVFILSVEIPDLEDDRQGGKRTWVARFGRQIGFTAIGCCLLAATGYFFLLPVFQPIQIPIDFRVLGALSLLPLLPGLWGWVQKPEARGPATQTATVIVLALALFLILIDGYLFLATMR